MVYVITNETALDKIFVSIGSQVPVLFPLLLFFEFIIIAVGGTFANQRRIGYSNFPMWASIGSLVTTTTAFILFLIDGLIPLSVLGVCVAFTFGFVAWFFFSGDES